ncbi:MAG: DNA helicase II [Stagnimonas sp.]|nr:DNA helicase II [Stagnimonas sp.]
MQFDALPETDPRLVALVEALNPAQREAVTAPPEHRLVLAGAGSGKTRVLTHRIAWLMAVENVSPHSLLAVTFTNKAANEMRGRIEQLVNVPVRAMWVGTFHGLAHKLLRLHWREARLVQNFQILDADDQQRLVKRVLKSLDMPEDRYTPKMVTGWINAQKEEGRRPHAMSDQGDYTQRQLVRAYTAYQQACEQQGLVDFAELLLRAYELFRDVADVRAHYHRKFRHVLVDEFQDTNTLQYLWLRLICGADGKIFAVGDDDQSIYGWRGAKVENIQKLSRDYPGIELVRLEQNYRSTATILKAANGLIAHNSGRLGKNLWTEDREGEAIQLYAAYNEYDEAEFVVQRMRDYLDGRGRYADLAVLYRSNAQSRVLEEMLIRARLPYRIYGGLRFFERMEVKDALAWLRLLANREDDGSFERALTTPPRGVGATSIEKLRAFAREHGLSLWKAARNGAAALGRTSGALGLFLDQIDLLDQQTRELPLAQKMEKLIERSGLKEHYKKEKGEQAEARLENLDELVNAAKSFERPDEEGIDPVLSFLTHAALEAGEGQATAGEDAVQLMTLHSAKGLEFPVVFMVGLENGLFPSMRAVDEGNLEEERRLCYVGITRARQQLTISYAESRRIHGVEQICAPSQFLKEIPTETLVETRPRAGVLRGSFGVQSGRGSYGGGAPRTGMGSGYEHGNAWRERQQEGYNLSRPALSSRMTAEVAFGGFKLGQRVGHPSFGEGTILSFDGEGERARVEIRFANAGTKWLMLSMAKLSAL